MPKPSTIMEPGAKYVADICTFTKANMDPPKIYTHTRYIEGNISAYNVQHILLAVALITFYMCLLNVPIEQISLL